MPRREKKTEYSGSKILGTELRRLRGGRTLEDIEALCKAPPLAGKIQPVSSSSLWDIEHGRQMPKLSTLFALSLVYRVSMNQLMGYVMEEQLLSNVPASEAGDDDVVAAFGRMLALGAWHEALSLAIRAERRATVESEQVKWRGNRATCLANLGLHDEAVSILTRCLESPAASRRQEYMILHNLADMYASDGNLRIAELLLREAHETLPEDATPVEVMGLESLRAALIVDVQELKRDPNERAVREALRLAQRAEKANADADLTVTLRLQCLRARAQNLLGNALLASKELESAIARAKDLGFPGVEARASLILAKMRVAAKNAAAAETLLLRAASLADACQLNDVLFSAAFELFCLLRNDRPGSAVTWLRRCRELAPLLPGNCPTVQAFERVVAELAP